MPDFNSDIIDEFRANAGKVSGGFAGAPMLLLHTIGARTGTERVNPLVYRREGDAWAIFASKGGAPTNPDWFRNLMAHPETAIEVGTETVAVRARVAEGDEHDRIWAAQKDVMPGFAEYEAKTGGRVIPVVVLEPAG
jgi:deazaflavin-dependent oxidoreductase (nitroreductase family)